MHARQIRLSITYNGERSSHGKREFIIVEHLCSVFPTRSDSEEMRGFTRSSEMVKGLQEQGKFLVCFSHSFSCEHNVDGDGRLEDQRLNAYDANHSDGKWGATLHPQWREACPTRAGPLFFHGDEDHSLTVTL
jgi:hypothetical protein